MATLAPVADMTPSNFVDAEMKRLLTGFSAEVTTPDRKALDRAASMMPPASPVYVASLPKDSADRQLQVCIKLRGIGLEPVPHIVARKTADERELGNVVEALAKQAGVTRALILGGDTDQPIGSFDCALQIIQSGLLEANGIKRIAIGCYPEGHPRIADDILEKSLFDKLEAAEKAGLDIRLISQLCFDPDIVADYIAGLRQRGVTAKIRVGLAGPAKTATLVKYAAICGVGPSLRALKERQSMTRSLLSGSTPEPILRGLAQRIAADDQLDIHGVHFFTFSSLQGTLQWIADWHKNH